MAISDDLNSIRTHLEGDYTALETLGVSVEDRNIENIKDMANQIYAKFPKTSYAEGSNITLSNTLKGKLDFENGIVGIGDTKQYSTQGINLFYINKADDSRTWNGVTIKSTKTGFSATGQASASGGYILIDRYVTLQAGTYRLRLKKPTTLTKVGLAKTDYSEIISIEKNSSLSSSFTLAEETNVCLRIVITNGETYNEENELMIYSGTAEKDFEQYTGNSSSPNPSYPQDIEVVRGKNLLEIKLPSVEQSGITMTNNEDGSITFKGTATSAVNFRIDQTSVSSADNLKTYIAPYSMILSKVEGTPTGTMYLGGYSDSNSWITPSCNIGATRVIGSNCKNAFCYIRFENGTVVNETIYPMIVKGTDINTSYLPYNTIEVVERGKNLFNPVLYNNETQIAISNISSASVTDEEFSFTASGSDMYFGNIVATGGSYANDRGIKIYRNGKEKISFKCTSNNFSKNYICAFNSNGVSLGYSSTLSYEGTYTFPENCDYVTFRLGKGDAVSGTTYKTKVMMAYGDEIPTYEPYQTPQTYQLSLGEYEFAKIGNYVDTIEYDVDEDKVYKNKAINKYQFTGNENFGKAGSTNLNGYIFNFPSVTTNILPPANNGTKANILSNAFITKAVDTIISEATYGIGIRSDKYLYIGAPLGSFENVSALQTYLANNITFMYYALQTEVKEEITGTLKDQIKALYYSHSFNGTTIIEINGNLPLIIKVRALKGE